MKKVIKGLIRINNVFGIVDINEIYLADFFCESGIKDLDKVKIIISKRKITIEREK